MITFSLNSFIKICLLDTGGRISELQRRLTGSGGYDFYKPLQKSVRAHCEGAEATAQSILDAPTNPSERKYNRDAYNGFREKFGSAKSLSPVNGSEPLEFPSEGVSISPNPLFSLTKGGALQIYSLWATQKPALTQKYGAVACHILRRAYTNTSLANGSFHLFDTTIGRSYSEKQVTNNTNLILMADVNSIGTLIREL